MADSGLTPSGPAPYAIVRALDPDQAIPIPGDPGSTEGKPPIPLPNNGDTGEGPIAQGMTAFEAEAGKNIKDIGKKLTGNMSDVADVAKTFLDPTLWIHHEQASDPLNLGMSLADTFIPRQASAAENPDTAAQALTKHVHVGNSVFDPRTGEDLSGARKWAVPMVPEATHYSEKMLTPEDYASFAGTHRDLFARTPNAQIGTHYDPSTGLHRIDIVGTTSNKNAATRAAAELGEKGALHLGRNEFEPNDSPRPAVLPGSLDDRFSLLRSQDPPTEPFSGIHYSNAKLSYIDGARRGAADDSTGAPAGAEAARVRLGDSGVGENAPPGFYVYKEGSLPEPSIAARKNASRVQGNFAFANIGSEPEWARATQEGTQDALAKGADPQTASAAGINHAENALRDAGFDGYYHPNQPHIRFIFDSHEATPLGAKPQTQQPLAAFSSKPQTAKTVYSPAPFDPSDPAGLLSPGEKQRNALMR